jgi:NADH-quinone oxidoreductase subunit C
MMTLEEIKSAIEAALPGVAAGQGIEIVPNPSPSAQHSLLVKAEFAPAVARFLRDAPGLRFDFLSNVSGVDWLDREVAEKVKVTRTVAKTVDGVEQQVEETVEETVKRKVAGYLEAVYHLYSIELSHGPLVLRLRTGTRSDQVTLPSLTPICRSAEFQEREIFDLYGIRFAGHPDLRRLLMWDEFEDFPMRKDYVEPDDYDYEPTPHDEVLVKAKANLARRQAAGPVPAPAAQEGAAQ